MKITPVASPHAINTPMNTNSGIKPDVRARAIAMLEGNQSQGQAQATAQNPQQLANHSVNPNNISPEEIRAITPQIPEPDIDKTVDSEVVAEEAAPTEPKAKVDPALSSRFAQLARQEKAARARAQAQDQALKQREAALAAKEAELASKSGQVPEGYISMADLKRNALGKLLEAGVSYDDLTQQIISSQNLDPRTEAMLSRAEQRIAQLEAKLEANAKSQTEAQEQAYKSAVKQIEMDARQLVKNDPNFETIRATNSISDVVELIERTWKEDQIVLSVEDAAQQVEDYLVEEAMKLTRVGKIKSRLEQSGQKVQAPKQIQAQTKQTPTPMKTLTNANSGSRQLSARERAVLAFKGELKS